VPRRDDRTRGTTPPRKLLWQREFLSSFDGARGKSSGAPTLGVHESRLPEASQLDTDTCSSNHRCRHCGEMLQGDAMQWVSSAPERRHAARTPFPTTNATLLSPHRRHHRITAHRVLAGRRGPTTRVTDVERRPRGRVGSRSVDDLAAEHCHAGWARPRRVTRDQGPGHGRRARERCPTPSIPRSLRAPPAAAHAAGTHDSAA
jgi:hypothetical protein